MTGRVPAGVPTGGQFAASAKDEPSVALDSQADAPRDAFEAAQPTPVGDLVPGDIVLFRGADGEALENVVLTTPHAYTGSLFGRPRVNIDMRVSNGEVSHDSYAADQTLPRAHECARHGGAWGNDETCPDCTDDAGRPVRR